MKDTWGTDFGCACIARDAFECAAMRYGPEEPKEECECCCHHWQDWDYDDITEGEL
jgi:hypothetical protein